MNTSVTGVYIRLTLLCVAATFLMGCAKSDKVPVTGKVTLKDGKPVAGTLVLFRSNKTGKSARGATDAEGNYELTSLVPGDGIPPGKYYVTLSQIMMGDSAVPTPYNAKYRSPTQELIFEVTDGGSNAIDMQLDLP